MIIELHGLLSQIDPSANNITVTKASSSYTINKKHMHLCLRDENGEYFNKNMLLYVAIHELAHVVCDEIGHTPKFHRIMDKLLDRAVEKGLYDPNIPPVADYQDRCHL